MGRQETAIIYHAFDTKTGMAYVGQTWLGLKVRSRQHHGSKTKDASKSYFHNALRKRPDDFVWSVLSSGITNQDALNACEVAFIRELGTQSPNGYNLTKGGQGDVRPSLEKRRIAFEKKQLKRRVQDWERSRLRR